MSPARSSLAAIESPGMRPAVPAPGLDSALILDHLPVAIIGLDRADAIVSANSSAEALLGLGRGQLLGQALSSHFAADSPLFDLVASARKGTGVVAEADLSLSGPKLSLAHAAVDLVALDDPAGHVLVVLRDRALEMRLIKQTASRDAARSAGLLAAMLAHEVKNPLSGIRGAAQLLESRAEPAERQLTRLIREETDRIVTLVNGLEIFTDTRTAAMEPVNIHEILYHVKHLGRVGCARHVVFEEAYDPSLPPILGNKDQLVQIFLNLVKNAAEACAENEARITLRTEYRPGFSLAGRGQNGAKRQLYLVASVADNGPGVPAPLQAQLFEPFVSGRPGGRGLGLALVAKLVADHQGLVACDSRPGKTVFSVLLPIADTASSAKG
jgi:two-component system, NtrC family, nitrogen regulation sensor histidine kinase GlnL